MAGFQQFRDAADQSAKAKMTCMGVGGGVSADKRSDEKMIKSGISQHENHEHGGRHTALKFADGGGVDMPAGERRDRRARGGANKKGPHVNVIVAPQMHGAGAPMPPAGPPPMLPPHPPMLPPGLPPGGPPPGGPPMMPPPGAGGPPGMIGGPPVGAMPRPPMMMGPRARGGSVDYPIDDGAGGGEARLEKIAAYGKNADKGEGKKRGGRA